jgi:hypothetical protein
MLAKQAPRPAKVGTVLRWVALDTRVRGLDFCAKSYYTIGAPDATSRPWSEDRVSAETSGMLEEVVPQVHYRVAQQGWHQVAKRVAVYEVSFPNAD